jgi:hypothetical protein
VPVWLEITLALVFVVAVCVVTVRYGLGWWPGRYDEVMRMVRDGNGHGLHVFARRHHSMDEGSYEHVTHLFLRKRDGKVFKTAFAEWSNTTARGSLRPEWGHRFEEAWTGGAWRETVQTLAKKSGLELSLVPTTNDNIPMPMGPTTVKALRALL